MKLGIFDEVNRIVSDGANVKPSMEFFTQEQFEAAVVWLEKFINRVRKWWLDGSRTIKRTVAEVRMALKKMVGIEPIKMRVTALFNNLCVDDGRISHAHFKQKFARLLEIFKNSTRSARLGYSPDAGAEFIVSKMSKASEDSAADLTQLKQEFDRLDDGMASTIEIGDDDIRELLRIVEQIDRDDFSSKVSEIDFVGDFKKVMTRITKEVGTEEAMKIAADISDNQKGVIRDLEAGSRLMFQVVGTIVNVSKKIATGNPSMEDFDVNSMEPLQVDDTPSNQLFEELGTISNEAMGMGNISKYFGRKADTLSVSIQEGFKYLTTYNYDPMETLHPKQLQSFVTGIDFFDHESMKVPQPNGLKGELLPVTAMLLEHAKVMSKVLNEVIRPATSRFGHYLSVPFDRAERRDFEFGISIGVDRIKLIEDEAKLYTGNRTSNTTLGAVFNSFADLVSAERNMQEVNALVHGGGTTEIKKAVQALVQTSGALIRRIGEDRNITASNEFAKMISEQLSEAGRWVEWYAAQMTRIIEVNNVLYEIEEEVLKL